MEIDFRILVNLYCIMSLMCMVVQVWYSASGVTWIMLHLEIKKTQTLCSYVAQRLGL